MFDRISPGIVALRCLIRGLPLLLAQRPKTPLRVLAIMALDTVHRLRCGRPMSRSRIRAVAEFLDFGACANAVWDGKPRCQSHVAAMRRSLDAAGAGPQIDEYLRQLRRLESRRPRGGGDHRRFDDIRWYREEVVRVSLAAAGAIAMDEAVDEMVRAIEYDGDMQALFRIALQCQIIDDVLDYDADVSGGLPSFLTATMSAAESAAFTAGVARVYGASHGWSSHVSVWPMRAVLGVVTAITVVIVQAALWQHRRALLIKSPA